MAQTNKTGYVFFPNGTKVSAKRAQDVSFFDIGAIENGTSAVLNWTANQYQSGNAGILNTQIRNMLMNGTVTLINLEPEGIERMGGGVMERVVVPGTAVTDSPDIVIPAGWADEVLYPLEFTDADGNKLKLTEKPTLTSVTLDAGGTPEVLVEGTEYNLVQDTKSSSGWSIMFISSAMTTPSPTTLAITVDSSSITPAAKELLYGGNSTVILEAYSLRFEALDNDGKLRYLELYLVDPDAGGFQFNFKGENEDGVETMPLTFTARIDISKVNGRQLFEWGVDLIA